MHFNKLILLSIILICSPTFLKANTNNEWIKAGDAQVLQRDYNQAIFFFDRAIEEYPNDAEGYLKRAKVLMLLHKYHEAGIDYKKALELDPNYIMRTVISPPLDSLNQTPPEKELFIN
ncbi:MAG: tetratricopeptide repeat protein [Bacteroidota bacterium]